jgi:DNA-binding GntR family transcriptional regulator
MTQADPALRGADGDGASSGRLLAQSELPLYYQLEAILESRIIAGTWPTGFKLPSERELCEEFRVSRAVVRPALEILERQGRVIRHQGKGTFVAPPKRLVRTQGLVSIFARRVPSDLEVHVLDAAERPADTESADLLGVAAGDPILFVSATIRLGGRPSLLCNSTIALAHVPWITNVLRTDARLSGCGPFGTIDLGPVRAQLETGVCPDFEAEQLELTAGGQVFVAQLTQFADPDKQPDTILEHAWAIYPMDSIQLEWESNPPAATAPDDEQRSS